MSDDSFIEINNESWVQRTQSSFSGAVIGLILFIASFVLLFWNEGRADLSILAKKSVEISSQIVDYNANLKLVSLSGNIVTNQKIGDYPYFPNGKYIAIYRKTEMFAWQEHEHSSSHISFGGSRTRRREYTYTKGWKESPENSSFFKKDEGHYNPPKAIESKVIRNEMAKVGSYTIDMTTVSLPPFSKVELTSRKARENAGFIYYGGGNINNPIIGDIRISYNVVNSGSPVTVIGKLSGNLLTKYTDEKDNTLFRIFYGTRDDAIKILKTEYVTWTWIFRAIGFLAMWLGLHSMVGIAPALLGIIPFLESLVDAALGAVTFIIALILSAITIFVSIMFHHPIYLILTFAVLILIKVIIDNIKKKIQDNKVNKANKITQNPETATNTVKNDKTYYNQGVSAIVQEENYTPKENNLHKDPQQNEIVKKKEKTPSAPKEMPLTLEDYMAEDDTSKENTEQKESEEVPNQDQEPINKENTSSNQSQYVDALIEKLGNKAIIRCPICKTIYNTALSSDNELQVQGYEDIDPILKGQQIKCETCETLLNIPS